jgi:hypothetical protein
MCAGTVALYCTAAGGGGVLNEQQLQEVMTNMQGLDKSAASERYTLVVVAVVVVVGLLFPE